jgi:hypothetical protein
MLKWEPQLHVIHLLNRHDRREVFEREFAEQQVNYRIWEGVTRFNPAQNINLAHKQIVRWAKENKLPYVIISEDDIMFPAPKSWKYFLSQLPDPKDFDLFLGMVYSAEIKDNRILNGFSGLTMYAVSAKFYDTFLSVPEHVHIDRHLGITAFENKYYGCHPMCCLQTGGISDNLRREMHYRPFLEDKEFLGQEGKVFDKGIWHDKSSPTI